MFIQIVLLAIGFVMLVKGADWFVGGAVCIADRFHIPPIIIGLTIVAMGTSAPEAAVSITSAFQGAADITVGNITLKEAEHKVIADGEKVVLTHKEFEMLKLFMQNPNMVFSREKLMSEIWGMDYIGETRTVDMHIKTLRHKLGKALP